MALYRTIETSKFVEKHGYKRRRVKGRNRYIHPTLPTCWSLQQAHDHIQRALRRVAPEGILDGCYPS